MNKLTWMDQRNISAFVRELYCLGSVQAISEHMVRILGTLIGGNSVLVALEDIKTGVACVLAENIGPELHRLGPVMAMMSPNVVVSLLGHGYFEEA